MPSSIFVSNVTVLFWDVGSVLEHLNIVCEAHYCTNDMIFTSIFINHVDHVLTVTCIVDYVVVNVLFITTKEPVQSSVNNEMAQ